MTAADSMAGSTYTYIHTQLCIYVYITSVIENTLRSPAKGCGCVSVCVYV